MGGRPGEIFRISRACVGVDVRIRTAERTARGGGRVGAQNGQLGTRRTCGITSGAALPLVSDDLPLGNRVAGQFSLRVLVKGAGYFDQAWTRRSALHRRIANSDSAGARTRIAGTGPGKIHLERHRIGANSGPRDYGATAGHAYAFRGSFAR